MTDSGTSGTQIAGNFIGTNAGGTAAVPNKNDGVLALAGTSGTTIGASNGTFATLNFISGNAANGIEVDAGGTGIYFTSVGTDVTDQKAIGNGGNGLLVNGVAGTNLQLDVIDNNAGYGILTTNAATNNSFRDSDIYNNTLGGILEQGNPSLQPAPQLTSATSVNGQTTITGTIFGSPSKSTTLSLDFFASPYSTSATSIQGQTYIGAANVTTDANGNANFTVTISATVPAGQIVTATSSLGLSTTSQFSNAVTVPAAVTSTATFLGTDTTTEGSWRNAYGADGYDIAADTSATDPKLPSYATLSLTGESTYVWSTTTTAQNALQNAAGTGRIASTWYSSTTFSIDLDITGGQAHEVSLYAVDFDKQNRSEQVQVLDAATGTVLSTETLSSFQGGKYLSWDLSGNVIIKVTNLDSASNAVISGIFFGGQRPARRPPSWARTRRPRVAGATSTAPTATTSPPTPPPPTPSSPPTPPSASPASQPTSGRPPRPPRTPCRTPPAPAGSPRPGTPPPPSASTSTSPAARRTRSRSTPSISTSRTAASRSRSSTPPPARC